MNNRIYPVDIMKREIIRFSKRLQCIKALRKVGVLVHAAPWPMPVGFADKIKGEWQQ